MADYYFTRSSVTAKVPPKFLLQALDDDGDGIEDDGLWDAIAEDACDAVDSFLGGRFAVPFAEGSVPALAAEAAKLFALETLYQRRGYERDTEPPNPWSNAASAIRARLKRIAAGDEPLMPEGGAGAVPGSSVQVVTEESRTTSRSGRMGY